MPLTPTPLPHGVSPLPHLGVIRVSGADAANFLHNQLTQDVLLLDAKHVRLAAFCNAKGRMQASFVLYKRAAEEVLLVCRRDLLAQTLKRLSMFVLRAKAKLTDASADFTLLGLSGDVVQHLCGTAASTEPGLRHVVNEGPDSADVLTIHPSQGVARALFLAPVGSPSTQAVTAFASLSAEQWGVAEVMSGVAWVELATFEAFVPQMLNYESLDGVNFKKGCYPGQEVVARSQFRGTLKRRAFIVQADEAMRAGQEIFLSADPSQPCGLVAQAASDGVSHVAIAELQLSATQGHSLHLDSAQGPVLALLPLPYPLRDDI